MNSIYGKKSYGLIPSNLKLIPLDITGFSEDLMKLSSE